MSHLRRRHHRARIVRDALRAVLTEGSWQDRPLPSESCLADQFNVGRNVVREALALLTAEGFIDRQRGTGTIARHPVHIVARNKLRSMLDSTAFKAPVETRVLHWERHIAAPIQAHTLQIPQSEEVLFFERLTHTRNVPLTIWSHIVRGDVQLSRPPEGNVTGPVDLYTMLELNGAEIGRSTIRISAVAADQGIAELLAISPGSPVLTEYRTVFSPKDRPLSISTGYFRPDYFSFMTEL
ncbi:GntR family transcriptional regulator [Nesterenkonia alkaliphila]|nr:GntR family transcriptional regulator [Nesterenkonia alkaliphila]